MKTKSEIAEELSGDICEFLEEQLDSNRRDLQSYIITLLHEMYNKGYADGAKK